jgi:hypothetical protein
MTVNGNSCNPESDEDCTQHIVVYHCVDNNQELGRILTSENKVYFKDQVFTHTSHWWTYSDKCYRRLEIWVPVNKVSLISLKMYDWDGFLLPRNLEHHTVVLDGPLVLTKINKEVEASDNDMMMETNNDNDKNYTNLSYDNLKYINSCHSPKSELTHHCGVQLFSYRVSHVLKS